MSYNEIYGFFNYFSVTVSEKSYARSILRKKKEKRTKKDQTTTNHLSHIIKSLF